MSFYSFEKRLERLKRRLQAAKVESLESQSKWLASLQARHTLWSKETEDTDIADVHVEIVDLLQETKKKNRQHSRQGTVGNVQFAPNVLPC